MGQAYEPYLLDSEERKPLSEWRKDCEQNFPRFRHWPLTLKLELIMLSFVRSIRTGNFTLYMESMQSLLRWFFALDHINWARWLSAHLMDMLNLHQTNKCAAECFEKELLWFEKQKIHSPLLESITLISKITNVLKGMEISSTSTSKIFKLKYDNF